MVPNDDIWLCLHFANLPLAVFDDRDPDRATVVSEQRKVHCSNRANLEPGLPVNTAAAMYTDLLILERQPPREAELLQSLAYVAYGFTPSVVVATDNSLLLEIGSCRKLHHGIKPLLLALNACFEERGQSALMGLAHTPKAAWLLGRYTHCPALANDTLDRVELQRQLSAIPLDFLPIGGSVCVALQQLGLSTLGEVAGLPVAALGKRFGLELMRYLEQLWGERADPQPSFVPAPVFRQGLTFLDGIPHRQMLLFPMKRLLQMLCDYLRARQLHCHMLRWEFFDAHQPQAEMVIELSRTHQDVQGLLELTRIKLDQVVLREAVFSLRLHSADFFATAPVSQHLFPDDRDVADAGLALLDRLQARLGKDALQRIETRESLWPEHSWTATPISHVASRTPEAAPQGGPRPLWLLPQPQPLAERGGAPILQRPLTLLRGPERVEDHWWASGSASPVMGAVPKEPLHAETRDYFVARTHDDRVCWIYRDPQTAHWYLHGWFA